MPADTTRAQGPGESSGTVQTMIEMAVLRLMEIIDEETEALRRGPVVDLKGFNERKSLGLMELSRAMRLLSGARPDQRVMKLIERLNGKLESNRQVIKLHIEAVREIASIIAKSIRDAESDGTYTFAFRSKGQAP
jgi:hypothetical protein